MSIIIWDLKKLCFLKAVNYCDQLISFCFLQTSKSLLVLVNDNFEFFNLKAMKKETILKQKTFKKNAIKTSSNLKFLAHGFNKVHLIDIEKNEKISKSSFVDFQIFCIVFSKKLSFVANGLSNKNVSILSFPSLTRLQKIILNLLCAKIITFSENEKFFGCSDLNSKVAIFGMAQKKLVFEKQISYCKAVIFTLDSKV